MSSSARSRWASRRPPVQDIRVTRPDGTVETFTAAQWRRTAQAQVPQPRPRVTAR